MRLRRLAILAVSAVTLSGISTVYATQISNSTGIVNPFSTQTFESPTLDSNSLVNAQFAQVSLSNTLYYDGNSGGGACAFFEQGGNCVTNFTSTPGNQGTNIIPTFSIFFSVPQTYADFAMVTGTHTDSDTFTAFLNGSQVAQFTVTVASNYTDPGNGTGNFFGFSNIAGGFNQIQVQTTGTNLALIDNIQLSSTSASIPEPGTIALFGLGMSGLVAFARRRRSA
jgi:hypothetical protein